MIIYIGSHLQCNNNNNVSSSMDCDECFGFNRNVLNPFIPILTLIDYEWNHYSENSNKLRINESLIIRGSRNRNLKSEMIESDLGLSLSECLICELYCKNLLFKSKNCKNLKCGILKADGI